MLIGARDEDGTLTVFSRYKKGSGDLCRLEDGRWTDTPEGIKITDLDDETAEWLGKNIPNGQSRVIDLSASTIVHVQPVKTAVEELVEACEFVDRCKKTDTTDCMRAMRTALARVKEAANAK